MFDKIRAALVVLQKGKELNNAQVWKDAQNLSSIVIAIIGAIVVFLPPNLAAYLTQDIIERIGPEIAAICVSVFALIQLYITTATTKRLGLPAKPSAGGDTAGPESSGEFPESR